MIADLYLFKHRLGNGACRSQSLCVLPYLILKSRKRGNLGNGELAGRSNAAVLWYAAKRLTEVETHARNALTGATIRLSSLGRRLNFRVS
jgi:hypothetical protein